jgi:hypothetical protein
MEKIIKKKKGNLQRTDYSATANFWTGFSMILQGIFGIFSHVSKFVFICSLISQRT